MRTSEGLQGLRIMKLRDVMSRWQPMSWASLRRLSS
jgi:hypothetical protein